MSWICTILLEAVFTCAPVTCSEGEQRLRVTIETDAGGDPDDEQSLVRFLLYINEWDVEGIVANRALTRDGENLNPERTGFGVVRRLVRAYGECYPKLVQHDPRYPKPDVLLERTVAGYEDRDEAVNLIISAVDRQDPSAAPGRKRLPRPSRGGLHARPPREHRARLIRRGSC